MFRKIVLSIIVFGVFLGLFEFSARLFEGYMKKHEKEVFENSGWQNEFFSSLFDWHEPDPDLLWRFKANLDNPLIRTNSEHLLAEEIDLQKKNNIFRILLLGDSSPVGLGLESYRQAFGELLKSYLALNLSDRGVELINAAVSGYTSEQIVRFMELKGCRYNPDLVIVYCGNNDASVSGPVSDRELLQAQKMNFLRRYLSRLAGYRVMRSLLADNLFKPSVNADLLKVRVEPEQFGENLKHLVQLSHRLNCPLVIIKPPVPYLWPAGLQFKIFSHVTGRESRLILPERMRTILGRPIKYCLDENLFRHLYGKGDKFTRAVYASAYTDSLSPSAAIAHYTALLARDSNDAVLYNNLGVSYWAGDDFARADSNLVRARFVYCREHIDAANDAGQKAAGSPFLYNIGINLLTRDLRQPRPYDSSEDKAFIYLDSALQADYFSLRIKKSYWREMDKLRDIDNVFVLDLPQIFQKNGGERLFIDHCHPTAEGHRLIARSLYDLIFENSLIK